MRLAINDVTCNGWNYCLGKQEYSLINSNKMFSHSTQRKYWMFCSERELANLREASNTNYIQNTIARDGKFFGSGRM